MGSIGTGTVGTWYQQTTEVCWKRYIHLLHFSSLYLDQECSKLAHRAPHGLGHLTAGEWWPPSCLCNSQTPSPQPVETQPQCGASFPLQGLATPSPSTFRLGLGHDPFPTGLGWGQGMPTPSCGAWQCLLLLHLPPIRPGHLPPSTLCP